MAQNGLHSDHFVLGPFIKKINISKNFDQHLYKEFINQIYKTSLIYIFIKYILNVGQHFPQNLHVGSILFVGLRWVTNISTNILECQNCQNVCHVGWIAPFLSLIIGSHKQMNKHFVMLTTYFFLNIRQRKPYQHVGMFNCASH